MIYGRSLVSCCIYVVSYWIEMFQVGQDPLDPKSGWIGLNTVIGNYKKSKSLVKGNDFPTDSTTICCLRRLILYTKENYSFSEFLIFLPQPHKLSSTKKWRYLTRVFFEIQGVKNIEKRVNYIEFRELFSLENYRFLETLSKYSLGYQKQHIKSWR